MSKEYNIDKNNIAFTMGKDGLFGPKYYIYLNNGKRIKVDYDAYVAISNLLGNSDKLEDNNIEIKEDSKTEEKNNTELTKEPITENPKNNTELTKEPITENPPPGFVGSPNDWKQLHKKEIEHNNLLKKIDRYAQAEIDFKNKEKK